MRRLLLIWLLFFAMNVGHAAIVTHLYDVSIPAENQSAKARQQYFAQGLLQVIERITGETGMARYPEIKKALATATDYVEQYSYEGSSINIKFSADQINHFLYQTGHGVWGHKRPSLLLWLVIEDQQQRRIIGGQTDLLIQKQILTIAKQKGIPLLLPLLDLTEISAIKAQDIWDQNFSLLREHSTRYGTNAILIGKIIHDSSNPSEEWEGFWQLLTDNDSYSWSRGSHSLEQSLAQGVAGSARYLKGLNSKKSYSGSVSHPKTFVIEISNLQSGEDLLKIEEYLRNFDGVTQVKIYQIFADRAQFEMMTEENGQDSFMAAVNLDKRLMATPKDSHSTVDLQFRLMPSPSTSPSLLIESNALPLPESNEHDENEE